MMILIYSIALIIWGVVYKDLYTKNKTQKAYIIRLEKIILGIEDDND